MAAGMARSWLVRPQPDVRRLGIRLGWSFRSKTVYRRPSASQHTHATGDWGHPSIHTEYYRSRQRIPASSATTSDTSRINGLSKRGKALFIFCNLFLGCVILFRAGFGQWIRCHVKVRWIISRRACLVVWQLCPESILLDVSSCTDWLTTPLSAGASRPRAPGQPNWLRSPRLKPVCSSLCWNLYFGWIACPGSRKRTDLFYIFFFYFWLFPL